MSHASKAHQLFGQRLPNLLPCRERKLVRCAVGNIVEGGIFRRFSLPRRDVVPGLLVCGQPKIQP